MSVERNRRSANEWDELTGRVQALERALDECWQRDLARAHLIILCPVCKRDVREHAPGCAWTEPVGQETRG